MAGNNEARLNSSGNNQQSKDTTHRTEIQTIFSIFTETHSYRHR